MEDVPKPMLHINTVCILCTMPVHCFHAPVLCIVDSLLAVYNYMCTINYFYACGLASCITSCFVTNDIHRHKHGCDQCN